jgi:hypothetical protein
MAGQVVGRGAQDAPVAGDAPGRHMAFAHLPHPDVELEAFLGQVHRPVQQLQLQLQPGVLLGQGRQRRAQVPAAKAGAAAQAQQARRRRPLLRQGLAQQVHLLGDAPRPCSTISPWAVSVIRRVERWNRRTCRPASSKAMRLLTRALKPPACAPRWQSSVAPPG